MTTQSLGKEGEEFCDDITKSLVIKASQWEEGCQKYPFLCDVIYGRLKYDR